MLVFILGVLVFLTEKVSTDSVFPVSSCPNIFHYERNTMNTVHGVMTFRNDMSGYYRVEVNMTLAAYTNQNIAIKRQTSVSDVQHGSNIVYHILFPPSNVVPKISSIVFNDKLYCPAVRDQEQTGGVTTLNAIDFFGTPIIYQGNYVKPTQIQPWEPSRPLQPLEPPKPSEPLEPLQPVQTPPPLKPVETSKPFIPVRPSKPPPTPTTEPAPVIYEESKNPVVITNTSTTIEIKHTEEYECGTGEETQALLVHGSPTSEGQFPWLTAMFHLSMKEREYKFKCAGNLVSNKYIITAAHCVRISKTATVTKENIILVLGKHNILSWAVDSEIRSVKNIYVHPEYSQPSDADLAVLQMSKAVEFSPTIKPVCLWQEESNIDTVVGINGTIVGWGRDEFDNAYVPEPKQLNMPVVSQEDCLRSDERFLKLTSHRTFCAGTRQGEGACTGDSGGGFLMRRNGKWTLRGIVSAALVNSITRSCDVNNYMVFADVPKYMSWISRLINRPE